MLSTSDQVAHLEWVLSRNTEGSGLRVIIAAGISERTTTEFGDMAELLSSQSVIGTNWMNMQSPRLLKTKSGFQIQNKMTRLLGLPPLMVGGMTPTTTML